MLSILVNILLFILVIGILTFVHELGHFMAAKIVGAKVVEFYLGFGPKLFSKKIKGTDYGIRILPLGGYVKILGDGDPNDGSKEVSDPDSLQNKSKIEQMFVMLAGVTMNILFAIIAYYIVVGSVGWKMQLDYNYEDFKPTGAKIIREYVSEVGYSSLVDGGNAKVAGLPEAGIISKIGDVDVVYSDEIASALAQYKGQAVDMEICNEECKTYSVSVSDEGKIGIAFTNNYYVEISYEDNKLTAGFAHLVNTLRLIVIRFSELFSQAKTTGDYSEISNSVSGPVGIYFLIDYFKDFGVITFLSIMGDLSLSLAIMNLLPIPALDGGRFVIVFIEGIIRKDLDERIKAIVINGSFILLMILVICILIKDIINIDSIKNMFG